MYVKKEKPKFETKVKLKVREPWELQAVRRNLEITTKDISGLLSMQPKHIYRMESNYSKPDGTPMKLYSLVLELICKERGTTFDEVLTSGFTH